MCKLSGDGLVVMEGFGIPATTLSAFVKHSATHLKTLAEGSSIQIIGAGDESGKYRILATVTKDEITVVPPESFPASSVVVQVRDLEGVPRMVSVMLAAVHKLASRS